MKILFLIGTGRCGSSVVHEVLARHPDVGFVSNLDDRLAPLGLTGSWNSLVYRNVPPRLTRKGRLRFAPSEGYRIFDREVSRVISRTHRDLTEADAFPWLAERMTHAVERRARAQGCSLFAHKFTGWPRAGLLGEVFHDAKFVHVVRDGRAVANSFLQASWWTGVFGPDVWSLGPLPPAYADEWERSGRSVVGLAAIAWKILIDAHEEAASRLDAGRWLTVRYEDVVANPDEWFERIVRFAGLEWRQAFARALARQPFRLDRREAFRAELGAEHVAVLDRLLREHLERYGYLGARREGAGVTTRLPGDGT
jgi:sulfotransferase family protein